MKKNVFSFSALCVFTLSLILTGCNSDKNNPDQPARVQTYRMTVNASKGADNTDPANGPKKILGLDPSGETISAAWQAGDVISVFNVTRMEDLGSLTAETGGISVQFSGDLTGPVEAGDELELFYLNPNYNYQAGTLDYISQNCDHAKGNVTVASVEGNSIYTEDDAVFVNQQAIVKFTLIDKTTGTTINPDFFEILSSGGFMPIPMPIASVLVSDAYSINGDGVLYVAIQGFASRAISLKAYVGTDDPYTFEKADVTFANGMYYAITVEMTPPAPPTPPTPGLISGQFEVAPGQYVNFSQGNLQYDFDNSRWQFAENQWDYIGLANGTNISSQSGVIDLFGWGTGNAPAKHATDADYSTYSEWGNNAIYNGGNTADFGWRTLTDAEWEYLLSNHDIYPTRFTPTSSYSYIYGYTLVPVLCDVNISMFDGIFYTNQDNWLNIYAPKGLVFLPAAGQRDVTSVTLEQNWKHIGQYWTSTNSGNELIPERGFEVDGEGGNTTSGYAAHHLGNSVRLVIDVE